MPIDELHLPSPTDKACGKSGNFEGGSLEKRFYKCCL